MKNALFILAFALSTQAMAETGAAFATTSRASTIGQKNKSGKKSEHKKQSNKAIAVLVTAQTKKSGESSVLVVSTSKENRDKVSIEVVSDKNGAIRIVEGFESGNRAYKSSTLEVGEIETEQVPTLLAFIEHMEMRDLVAEMIIAAKQNEANEALKNKASKLKFHDYVAGLYSTHDAFAELESFNEAQTKKNN